ncbi:MAG: LysM peptidoglycan-binding domain-containing protein [Christensenellales bacterium]|jgi:spore germination protein
MQIYVIRPGDTLYAIARTFNSTVSEIVQANQIPEPDRLVVGQALVIPIVGSYYFVQPGDSLWSIGQRFSISYLELAEINNINPAQPLRIGLRLYIPPQSKTLIESNAYLEPVGNTISAFLLNDARQAADTLTYLAPFSYQARRDGTLRPVPLNGLEEITRATGATLMMVITNIEDGRFSGELGRDILQSVAVQDLLLDNIVAEINRVGLYTDVHFDFEFLPVDQRVAYANFLRRATARLRPLGLMVSAALAPKTSADQPGQWYQAHDYGLIAGIVDFVVIMTYEWGYSGGPPMPVSPIGPVEQVLRYALTEMDSSKILMGQNLYGYDWTLPFVPGERFARAISPQLAINIARDNNASIQYDNQAQAPFFNYTSDDGSRHIVWFEDARSIQAKFNLLKRLNLRGISYWKLGLPFPQNWLLLEDNFNIIKK